MADLTTMPTDAKAAHDQAQICPEGFVLAPIQVTEEMTAAAEEVEDLYRRGTPRTWTYVYRAMLAAAPTPPAATPVLNMNKLAEIIRASGYVTWGQAFEITEAIERHLATPQGERETEQKQGE